MWFLTHFYFARSQSKLLEKGLSWVFIYFLLNYHSVERFTYKMFFHSSLILVTSKYSKQFASEKKCLPLVSLQVPKPFSGPIRLHSSNPNLSTLDFGEEKNYSDGSETSSEFSKMQEDLCHIAHKGKWVFFLPDVFDENVICISGYGMSLERGS